MEGTNAKWCHAKSAAYVRDAKPEGDVHSNLPKQRSPLENRDLTLSRFGFRVRENKSVRLVAPSATGLKKKKEQMVRDHVRQRAVRILFSDIVNKAVWEPTPHCTPKDIKPSVPRFFGGFSPSIGPVIDWARLHWFDVSYRLCGALGLG